MPKTRKNLAILIGYSERQIGRWEAKGISPVTPIISKKSKKAIYSDEDVSRIVLWLAETGSARTVVQFVDDD